MSPSPATDRQAALTLAIEALEAGREVALVTVLETYGSAPRRPGSLWVIFDPAGPVQRQAGSVSGGCVEDELLDWLATRPAESREGRPVERRFDGLNGVFVFRDDDLFERADAALRAGRAESVHLGVGASDRAAVADA